MPSVSNVQRVKPENLKDKIIQRVKQPLSHFHDNDFCKMFLTTNKPQHKHIVLSLQENEAFDT